MVAKSKAAAAQPRSAARAVALKLFVLGITDVTADIAGRDTARVREQLAKKFGADWQRSIDGHVSETIIRECVAAGVPLATIRDAEIADLLVLGSVPGEGLAGKGPQRWTREVKACYKFCYDQLAKGVAQADVVRDGKKKFDGICPESKTGIKKVAASYASEFGMPPIRSRRPGARKRSLK